MTDDSRTATFSRERRVSAAVFHWATGLALPGSASVALCTSGDGLAEFVEQDGAADVYLAPTTEDLVTTGADGGRILRFEGRFAHPGDVMHIGGGYEVELKDYLAVPFMPITRPTIVTCTTSASWQAFIEDADEARTTGIFIPQLSSPSAVLADQSVIEAAVRGTRVAVNRLTIDAATSVRYRLGGPVIGSVGEIDLEDQPVAAFLHADGESPDAGRDLAGEFAARPWIRRYLAALRVIGGAGGETLSVSGFGAELASDVPDRRRRRSGHLIAWRGEEYQLIAESGRRFALGRETAIAIESLLESPSLDEAHAAARAAGITRTGLRRELDELRVRLDAAGVTLDLADAGGS